MECVFWQPTQASLRPACWRRWVRAAFSVSGRTDSPGLALRKSGEGNFGAKRSQPSYMPPDSADAEEPGEKRRNLTGFFSVRWDTQLLGPKVETPGHEVVR